jgi:phospholipase A1
VVQKVSDLNLIGAAPKFDPNVSLLDRRWELSEESKLGVWNIRAYQPVYLLPVFGQVIKTNIQRVRIQITQ